MYYGLINSMNRVVAPSYTARTTAFATATGITDATILGALNTFDLGLISNSLDTKMKAVYPMVGGTSTTCKYNFMNAVDSNSAFRLQFFGGGTFSSNGYKPNGSNAYANTFYNQSTLGDSANSGHLSYYSRTNSNGAEIEWGAEVNSVTYQLLSINRSGGITYTFINQFAATSFSDTDSLGFYLANRTASNVVNGWKSGVKKVASSTPSTVVPNIPLYLAGFNSTTLYSSNKECAFASIGSGLTDGEATAFSTLVQNMQVTLSRNV